MPRLTTPGQANAPASALRRDRDPLGQRTYIASFTSSSRASTVTCPCVWWTASAGRADSSSAGLVTARRHQPCRRPKVRCSTKYVSGCGSAGHSPRDSFRCSVSRWHGVVCAGRPPSRRPPARCAVVTGREDCSRIFRARDPSEARWTSGHSGRRLMSFLAGERWSSVRLGLHPGEDIEDPEHRDLGGQ